MAKAKAKEKDPEPHEWRIANPRATCPKHQKKEYRLLVEKAWGEGWKCVRRRKYIFCFPPDKTLDMVKIPMTPSDSRTLENVKRNLRAAGLDV